MTHCRFIASAIPAVLVAVGAILVFACQPSHAKKWWKSADNFIAVPFEAASGETGFIPFSGQGRNYQPVSQANVTRFGNNGYTIWGGDVEGIVNVTPFGSGYTVWGGRRTGITNVTPFGNGYTIWGNNVAAPINVTPFGEGETMWGPGINGVTNITPFGNGETVWGGDVDGVENVTPFGDGYTVWP